MHGIAPTEKDTLTETLEKRLRASAAQFRANSGPILDLACGSGGMFCSSAPFEAELKTPPRTKLSRHGVKKTDEYGRFKPVFAKLRPKRKKP